MKVHELKCWPEPFEALWRGMKVAEYRLNDRDFKAGDIVELEEWKRETEQSFCAECRHSYRFHKGGGGFDAHIHTCQGLDCNCTRDAAWVKIQPVDPGIGEYTRRKIVAEISHVEECGRWFSNAGGWVVLSLRVTEKREE